MSDIDDFIRAYGVTKCPPAAAAPTTARFGSALLADRAIAQSELETKMAARRHAKGRLKWLQGKTLRASDRRAKL